MSGWITMDSELRRLWDEGLPTTAIAAKLQAAFPHASVMLTKNSVIGRAHRLMLTPRANPKVPKKKIAAPILRDRTPTPSDPEWEIWKAGLLTRYGR